MKEPRVQIRDLTDDDERAFVTAAHASIELHHPWAYPPTEPERFPSYLARFGDDKAYAFVVELIETGALVGYVTISQVQREPYERGTLGYGVFVPHQQHGYMTEALDLVIRHAFDHLRLHRLEAEIQPQNEPSVNLVKKLGFEHEGSSRGLICIEGVWQDHERWACVAPHPVGSNGEVKDVGARSR